MYLADLSGPNATETNLSMYANDPHCTNAGEALEMLRKIVAVRIERNKEELIANPFNPRYEISADGRYIARQVVKHLWIIFVLLPIVLGILYGIVK